MWQSEIQPVSNSGQRTQELEPVDFKKLASGERD
jgi:hypothetical protein